MRLLDRVPLPGLPVGEGDRLHQAAEPLHHQQHGDAVRHPGPEGRLRHPGEGGDPDSPLRDPRSGL